MKPHKHAELIKAWADGAEIERNNGLGYWLEDKYPTWDSYYIYRIKPEPKPDVVYYYFFDGSSKLIGCNSHGANLRLICDGETRKLKDAEVLK